MLNSSQTSLSIETSSAIKPKRLQVIDTLRGFALFGILLVHSYSSFLELLEATPNHDQFQGINKIIDENIGNLFSNTLYSIFSLLFGLSFAIQLQSASRNGKPFTGRFIWRLTILMAIGYLHSLVFPRDILQLYALLGFLLVLFVKAKNGTVLVASAFMFALSFLVIFFQNALMATIIAIGEAARASHLYQLVGLHKIDTQIMSGRLFSTTGLFLLGLYAGKKNIFEDNPRNRNWFWKIFIVSLVLTVASFIAFKTGKANNTPEHILQTVFAFERLAQSFFYVALIVKIYKIRIFHRIWDVLARAGQMGLTIYISQSLFMIFFYSSWTSSMVTNMEPASIVGITCLFFVCQIFFALWWLSKYRYGPLEWAWRSLTYFKMQPLTRPQDDPSAKA